MLRQFVTLSKGDFLIQNGANSAVGEATRNIRHIIQTYKFLFRTSRDPNRSGPRIQDYQLCAQQV